ncbi:HDOD domain-containing protein [Thalassotalea euphylliae]|uniref:HDOD domain-containing protein n=1 Tax=Thalassotalea euphylliae TaxID=1655234 RepID=A0A3E0ULQ3_9GAMM|nr:HDOD domain-containing protein [Thalassotalea euphylliae]REL36652.1 HDOD domain-containing protein [Thalassotalea euphylliae]
MKLLLIGANSADQATLNKIFSRGNHTLSQVANAEQALELLAASRYDVVVVNEQLADMAVEACLKALIQAAPHALKIVVTHDDNSDFDLAHEQIRSPIHAAELVALLEAMVPQHRAITKKHIVDAVAKIKTLPSPPKVYMQLNQLLKQSTTDSAKIAEIISRDPALVAKVLQFVNSSAMAKGKQITNIGDAITKMGVDTLCCIVMTAEMFSYQPNIPDFSIEQEQQHCLATARMAASIVKAQLKQQALLTGLLHGIGKLVLYEVDEKQTKKFMAERLNGSDNIGLEQKLFNTDHAQVGGYLLHLWGFPYAIVEALVLQYQPEKLLNKPFGTAHAVYLANTLLKERELSPLFIEKFKLEPMLEKLVARAEKIRNF